MDELYAFLFAGLLIIFLLAAFFNGPEVSIIGSEEGKDYSLNNLTWKEIGIGDVISKHKTVETMKVLEDEFSVQNGFFFGSTEYSRKLDIDNEIISSLNNADLKFSVDSTNNYGSLMVALDNSTVMSEKPMRGEYSVSLSGIKNTSTLKIKTTSSTWRIWAPSKYTLSNLSLGLSYSSKENPFYEFDVPYYVHNTLYRGEIKFDSIYSADMKIFLNGEEIYNKKDCYGRTSIKLMRRNVLPEENIIEFFSEDDYRLENSKIYLYYGTGQEEAGFI